MKPSIPMIHDAPRSAPRDLNSLEPRAPEGRHRVVARGLSGARWRLAECDKALLGELAFETDEPELLLRCLINRGLTTAEGVRKFLNPDFHAHLHDPLLLRDMPKAVERIHRAIRDCEPILACADFDVDGSTGCVILTNVIKLIGGEGLVTSYIPDRFTEGYGLSAAVVERAATEGVKLIITADIGIKSHAETSLARKLGIDVIICDHHLPDGEDVPEDAFAVICPKGSSGEGYPNQHLAACGVSLKLADALLSGDGRRERLLDSFVKLVAIGTVADLVNIADPENRAIVCHGLKALTEQRHHPGLRALLEVSRVSGPVTADDLGFKLGPRINAAGRIAHANAVLDLFSARTMEEARRLAQVLDELNAERQAIQSALQARLLEEVTAARPLKDKVLLLAGAEADGYHRGVVGIAASKIVEATGRPTLIAAVNAEGVAHGSGRSIAGFHLIEALEAARDLVIKYGGHPMAAGFTIMADNLEALRRRLNLHADRVLSEDDLGRLLTADAELAPEDLTPATVEMLNRLAPFGMGNPAPLFLFRAVPLRKTRVLKDRHLKLTVGPRGQALDALWWNSIEHLERLAGVSEVSLLASPEINSWQGIESVQLKIVDLHVS